MADRPSKNADEVMDYLLGQLTPAARQDFEARLETDAALRAHVREVEQSVVALAVTAPSREAPPEAWSRIEAAVTRRIRRETWFPFLRSGWLSSGWAAASLAVAVVIAQWFWFHRSAGGLPGSAPPANTIAASAVQKSSPRIEETPRMAAPRPADIVAAETSAESATTAELRQKIARLEAQLARLQTVTQSPPGTAASAARSLQLLPPAALSRGMKNLSPQLQQAVLLAVARKMGWTLNAPADASQENVPAVDFVDWDMPTNTMASAPPTAGAITTAPALASQTAPAPPAAPISPPPETTAATSVAANAPNSNSGNVPILAWGDQMMVAIDPGTLPPNSGSIAIWQMSDNGDGRMVGTVPVGDNPTVVNLHNFSGDSGQHYFITVGATNVIGQFPQGN